MRRKNRAGFTLVEVLTVIAIIALLAGLMLGLASNAQRTAGRRKAEAEVAQLQSFATDYQTQYGQVPQTRDILRTALENASHPLAAMVDPWGSPYEYQASSRATFYLWSRGGEMESDPANDNRAAYIGNPPP